MGDTELKLEGAVKQFIFGLGCPKKLDGGPQTKILETDQKSPETVPEIGDLK